MGTATERMLVRIEADTSGLRGALEKGDFAVGRFEQNINNRLGKVSNAFIGLGRTLVSAGIGVGIGLITTNSLQAVRALADLNDQSEQLGVSVEKLQELGIAALKNGSDVDTMNKSLEQFTRRLGEAQAGSGPLLDILQQYGIAVRDTAGKNRETIDVLNDLADVLASVGDETQKARIVTEAFGKSGAKLTVVLSQGSAGLRQLGEEAQASGLIINKELIEKAAKFDNQWKNATYAGSVYFKTFVINAASEIDALTNKVYGLYAGMNKAAQQSVTFSKVTFPDSSNQKSDLENLSAGGKIDGLESFVGTIQRRMDNLAQLDSPFKKLNEKSNEEAKKVGDNQVKAYKNVIDNLKFETEQLTRTSTEQAIYNNLKQAGVSASSKEGQQIDALTRAYKANADAIEESRRVAQEFGDTITQSMNDAILGTEGLGASLRKIALSIANSVLSKYITGPAGDFLGQAAGNLFKFENGGIMTARGSLPLRAYAGGGIASSPQLTLFGEGRTPEAYVPLPDGRTIPVTMSGGKSGGSINVVQHLNITTGVEQTTRAEIMRMMPQIRQAAVSAVSDASKRGTIRF